MSTSVHTLTPATYRISALSRAFLTMWRGWQVFVPVVVLNALLQAVISAFPYSPSNTGLNILTSFVSALVFLVSAALVVVTARNVPTTRVTWPLALGLLRQQGLRLLLWGVVLVLVISLGLALFFWPGIVILALTPFVLLASVAGEKNPVAVNFRALGRRFWRWLVTALIVTVLGLLSYVIFGFTEFFLRGVLGAGVVWLIIGLAVCWIMTAWSLILRSAQK